MIFQSPIVPYEGTFRANNIISIASACFLIHMSPHSISFELLQGLPMSLFDWIEFAE